MKFKILAKHIETNEEKVFLYDNETNTLKNDIGSIFEFPERKQQGIQSIPFSKDVPLKKSKLIRVLKIQMGLSCNYSCEYCSQKFVERADETSAKHVPSFLKKLENLDFKEDVGLKIEFWGGEPFVYWKTMKPLAEALIEKFKNWEKKPSLSVITNGSLLTYEINEWLVTNNFQIAISHDGPGQAVRGPDPFDDPLQKEIILDLYSKLRPLNKISFNSMLNSKNISRKDVHNWFVEKTGDPKVSLGEGGLIDAYDEDGFNNSISDIQEHFNFRRTAFNDIYSNQGDIGFSGILEKIDAFVKSVLNHSDAEHLPQKCGMDNEHIIAVDLMGNVITCQNTSAVSTSHNGFSHLSGKITDIENVKIRTSTHWRNRLDCSNCPVLHICKGSCMFLSDKYWDISCKNSYTDNIVIFALGFQMITNGFIPSYIDNELLPPERRDIWGNFLDQHKDKK